MSKKLFTLIYGDKVHLTAEDKLVPAQDFSKMLDAKEIIEHVKQEAETYRKEVIAECEKQKETATKEGFEAGFTEWAKQLAFLEKEMDTIKREMEKAIIPIALKAAKKIVGRELETSQETVVDIVSNSLKVVSQHKKVTIYVSRQDLEIIEKKREKLKEIFEAIEALSIREREDIEPGGCVIETEVGIINAQLENQWQVLENAFVQFLQEEKAKA